MTTYLITNDAYTYQEFDLEVDDIIDFMPEDHAVKDLYFFSLNNISFKEHWSHIESKFTPIGGDDSAPIPDIARWINATLVLSSKAHDTLHKLMEPFGELLPVQVGEETFYVFNCLTLAKVDDNQSEQVFFEGQPVDIKKMVFDENDIAGKTLFKTKYNKCIDVYCNDEFREAVEKSGLKGVQFKRDLVMEY